MPYATLADLKLRYGETEITRLAAEDGQVDGPTDTARVDGILAAASATIDSYIARRYVTPVSPVPLVLVDCCCKLARYDLAQGGQSAPSDQMRAAQKDAMRWLESVAAGSAALLDADPISLSGATAQASDRPALFQPRGQEGLY